METFESLYSVFDYQYRDAGNYKAPGLVLLLGPHDAALDQAIHECCDSWDHFVAEQVGLPTLYAELYIFSDGPTIDDIAFHEFQRLRPATREEAETLPPWGTLDDLVGRFRAVRYWDCALSPHCW